jgi:hypothetical protein
MWPRESGPPIRSLPPSQSLLVAGSPFSWCYPTMQRSEIQSDDAKTPPRTSAIQINPNSKELRSEKAHRPRIPGAAWQMAGQPALTLTRIIVRKQMRDVMPWQGSTYPTRTDIRLAILSVFGMLQHQGSALLGRVPLPKYRLTGPCRRKIPRGERGTRVLHFSRLG